VDSREAASERMHSRLSGKSAQYQFSMPNAKGTRTWFLVNASPIQDATGISGGICFLSDITDVRDTEAALRTQLTEELNDSQNRLGMALKQSGLGIWEPDFKTGKVFWSETMAEILGYPPDFNSWSLTGEQHMQMIYEKDRKEFLEKIRFAVFNRQECRLEVRVTKKDGTICWVKVTGKGVPNEIGEYTRLLAVVQDITEEKERAQKKSAEMARLAQLSKMSALGEMASNIAHEVNNPVTIIQGLASVIHRRAENKQLDADELLGLGEQIQTTCNRITRIVEGLRFLSRDGSSDPFEKTDLKDIV
jgi:PAS domain S-box-containing protein